MKHKLTFLCLLGLAVSCRLFALPTQIVIISPAEIEGKTGELSLKGKERVAVLVPYFLETPQLTKFGTPAAIYASIPPQPAKSEIATNTVQPLADALKLSVINTFESNDYRRLAEEIKTNQAYDEKAVLICWEKKYIPELARAFGALQTPATWPNRVFDRTWIITFTPSKRALFQQVAQRLLFGDSSI